MRNYLMIKESEITSITVELEWFVLTDEWLYVDLSQLVYSSHNLTQITIQTYLGSNPEPLCDWSFPEIVRFDRLNMAL